MPHDTMLLENVVTLVCDEDWYRYGYNGQMKVNEIAGLGNHTTALYWEYDTRTGRRGNQDPVMHSWESSYATFGGNPIWRQDHLGNTTSFATDKDKDFVMQFVNKKNEDGSKNPLYRKEYAKKYSALEKSKTDYHFQSFVPDEKSDKQGGVTSPDPNTPNRINISFTTELSTEVQKSPGIGLSPFASLWEETYHAWDYENGKLDFHNHSAFDEARAWKFSVTAPGTQYTINTYVPEENKTYTDYTAAYRILNADAVLVATWLKDGVQPYIDRTTKIQYYGMGIKDPTATGGLKGLYFMLPLGVPNK